jgi:hypothetical protein
MEKDNKERNTADNNTVSLRNTLNELTGSEWLYFTKNILITAYSYALISKKLKADGEVVCLQFFAC